MSYIRALIVLIQSHVNHLEEIKKEYPKDEQGYLQDEIDILEKVLDLLVTVGE